jgi:hypothetical protein
LTQIAAELEDTDNPPILLEFEGMVPAPVVEIPELFTFINIEEFDEELLCVYEPEELLALL